MLSAGQDRSTQSVSSARGAMSQETSMDLLLSVVPGAWHWNGCCPSRVLIVGCIPAFYSPLSFLLASFSPCPSPCSIFSPRQGMTAASFQPQRHPDNTQWMQINWNELLLTHLETEARDKSPRAHPPFSISLCQPG